MLNDDAQSREEVQEMITWLDASTNSNVNNIKAGYTLDGSPIGNYSTTFFAAPFAVAAMLDANQQDFLNDIYAYIYNKKEHYYEDSVNLLVLLAITANYWNPAISNNSSTDICGGVDEILSEPIMYPETVTCSASNLIKMIQSFYIEQGASFRACIIP